MVLMSGYLGKAESDLDSVNNLAVAMCLGIFCSLIHLLMMSQMLSMNLGSEVFRVAHRSVGLAIFEHGQRKQLINVNCTFFRAPWDSKQDRVVIVTMDEVSAD